MSLDRATEICALFLVQRVVDRQQVLDLEDDGDLFAEVKQRLERCGLTLTERTGIAYKAVVIRQEIATDEITNELGLDRRALALILRAWILLVAPHLYTGGSPPSNLSSTTVTREALSLELQEHWAETTLKRYISVLVQAKFLKHVHGQAQTYTSGPMLWLGIRHDVLIEQLKRAAVPFTVKRIRELQVQQDKEVTE